jgi:hypothetical protein
MLTAYTHPNNCVFASEFGSRRMALPIMATADFSSNCLRVRPNLVERPSPLLPRKQSDYLTGLKRTTPTAQSWTLNCFIPGLKAAAPPSDPPRGSAKGTIQPLDGPSNGRRKVP